MLEAATESNQSIAHYSGWDKVEHLLEQREAGGRHAGDAPHIDVDEYYRRVTSVDIGEVARELLGDRIEDETRQRLHCDCPNHKSDSKLSLHIMLDKQGWYCFGCGVGGDVLQLVEFVRFGKITKGQKGSMPESHRLARDYLAEKAGLPPLSSRGWSKERLEQAEAERQLEVKTQETLTEIARLYHQRLRAAPKMLEWVKDKYGFSDETIDSLLIGFADNDEEYDKTQRTNVSVIDRLLQSPAISSEEDLWATSAFRHVQWKGTVPFFDNRIVFPYWSRGRVAYMIGRKTPWTPDKSWEKPKYKKLPVYDEEKRSQVANCIHNGHIFNADCLLTLPEEVMITEGVTDCISAMQCGIPCISPVTTSFRKQDIEMLLRATEGVKSIVIINDSEVSGAGEKGALKTAEALSKAGRNVRIGTILLPEGKEKIDVNELVMTQGPNALNEVISKAKRLVDYLLKKTMDAPKGGVIDDLLEPVLQAVANEESLSQEHYLAQISKEFDLGRRALRKKMYKILRERECSREGYGELPESGLPPVKASHRQLSEIVEEVSQILIETNQKRIDDFAGGDSEISKIPIVFSRSGSLVWLRLDVQDAPVRLVEMDLNLINVVLARIADWYGYKDGEFVPIFPPDDVGKQLCSLAPAGLPEIETVISSPVFGESGKLLTEPGYHEEDRLWLHPGEELNIASVPAQPNFHQVAQAQKLIFDELFVDFPLLEQADRAAALALLLLPFMRRMIQGPTPLHLLEAPTPGSGKSLFCSLISIVATGSACESRTLPDNEEEMRKMITAELARAYPMVLLDNASQRRMLDSNTLASVTTTELWTDRVLGQTRMLSLGNKAVWMLTANNPRVSNELARRCIRIRLDPKQDRPWQRSGFKHDPILEWVRSHRSELAHAALTLIQFWISKGKPGGERRLGSFEHWSVTMDGLLRTIGVPGFLDNLEEFYEQADTEGEMWREFTKTWWEKFGDRPMRARELTAFCEQESLMEEVRGGGKDRSQQSKLGRALQKARDRVFGDLMVVSYKDTKHRGRMYQLKQVSGEWDVVEESPADDEVIPF